MSAIIPLVVDSTRVWTFRLGMCPSTNELLASMSVNKMILTHRVQLLLRQGIPLCPTKKTGEFVPVRVKELGFPAGTTYLEFCTRAVLDGYELCPPEITFPFRRSFKNQPRGHIVRIAMDPLHGMILVRGIKNRAAFILVVGNGNYDDVEKAGNPWIDAEDVQPDDHYGPEEIFLLMKKGTL